MRVGINQARQYGCAAAIHHLRSPPHSLDLICRSNGCNVTPFNGNSALGHKISQGVHGHHEAVDQQDISRLYRQFVHSSGPLLRHAAPPQAEKCNPLDGSAWTKTALEWDYDVER